jgi:hypothetical protein
MCLFSFAYIRFYLFLHLHWNICIQLTWDRTCREPKHTVIPCNVLNAVELGRHTWDGQDACLTFFLKKYSGTMTVDYIELSSIQPLTLHTLPPTQLLPTIDPPYQTDGISGSKTFDWVLPPV